MEVRKAMKRVIALGAGSAMVGATIMGAMAADLNDWPAPFIKKDASGKPVFDAWLVVGDTSQPTDIIGITDIAMSLQAQMTSPAGSGSGSSAAVAVSGDAWQVGSAADRLELGEAFDQALTRISASDLSALSDGTINNQKGTAGYEQFVRLEDGSAVFEEDTDSDVVADYVRYSSGHAIMNYSLEFTQNFESDVTDSAGSASTTGTYFLDFEDEDITIFGKSFSVLTARRDSSTGDGIKLTLLGGDLTATLQEGETQTFTLNGKQYEVENAIVTDSGTIYTQLKINGVLTRKLQEDQTEKLPDGTVLGVKDILPNEAGDVTGDVVRFTLGAEKLFLQDTDVTNAISNSAKVDINDETINDVDVIIKGSNDNSTFAISGIFLNLKSDDDIWVPKGKMLSQNAELDEDSVKFLTAFDVDVKYEGMTDETTEDIKVVASGDDKYNLEFVSKAGNKITVPIAYDSTSASSGGDSLPYTSDATYNITLHPTTTGIGKSEYFMVTDKTNNEDGYTEVLQYKSADTTGGANPDANPVIKFKLLGAGTTVEKTLSMVNGNAQAKFTIGGSEYTVENTSEGGTSANADDFRLNITSAPSGVAYDTAITSHGAKLQLVTNFTDGDSSATGPFFLSAINISMSNPASQYDSAPTAEANSALITYTVSASVTDDMVGLSRNGGLATATIKDDTNVRHGMNSYGTWVEFVSESSKPQELSVKVPKNQRYPQVFLTSGATSSNVVGGESGGAVVVTRINVGATVLASKVADVGAQNMIVVGGPYVNVVSSTLQGSPTPEKIGELYQEGKATIKLFENSGKVAMLVAGYSAQDTTRATVVVAKDNGAQLKALADGVKEVSVNTINPTPVIEVASAR